MTAGPEHRTPLSASAPETERSTAEGRADVAARKRAALGLSPRRPTARADPQRPPERRAPRYQAWSLVGLVIALATVTLLITVAVAVGAPTAWPDVVHTLFGRETFPAQAPNTARSETETVASGPARLSLFEPKAVDDPNTAVQAATVRIDFAAPSLDFGQQALPNIYVVGHDDDAQTYRMRLWPANAAWVVFGPDAALSCSASQWLEARASVGADTPSGHAALMAHFVDQDDFLLFSVNGRREFEVVARQDGRWTTLHAAQTTAAIHPAGTANDLALRQTDGQIEFWVNGTLLFQGASSGSTGRFGIAGRSVDTATQIDFERLAWTVEPCATARAQP